MAITLTDNEFLAGLTNLALYIKQFATNDSGEPDRFVDSFATETLSNGNTKIFPFSNMPTVADYSGTSSLLTVTKVPVNEEAIQITEKKVIKSSFTRYILEMAFTSDSGMNAFTGYLLGQMESAKTDYIYDAIISDLYAKTFSTTNKQTQVITQYPMPAGAGDINSVRMTNQKNIGIGVQNVVNDIEVYNTQYNAKGYKQALSLSNMRFVIANPYYNEQIMNLYASLLNSSVLDSSFKKPEMLVVPSIKVPAGKSDVIGFLLHKSAYQFFYKFTFMGTFFDVSNLAVNNFLHFWLGKGWLDNLPAVKFTAKQATGA